MPARTHVALLRGINVGGKHKLPMQALAAIFEEAGCADVRTYIQSGNVAFRTSAATARRLPDAVADAIEERFGFRAPVVLRTAKELRATIERNPFADADVRHLSVGFLAAKPAAAQVRGLDPDRSPPDRFVVVGREIYFCFPNGVARTKLTSQYFDSRLRTVVTVRNWKTTLKLVALVG